MESKPASNMKDIFMLVTTVTGFVVDIVTLFSIFSTIGFDKFIDASNTQPDSYIQIPKIAIIGAAAKWGNISLAMIFYSIVALVFFVRLTMFDTSTVKAKNDKIKLLSDKVFPQFASAIWVHIVLLLLLFWSLVFIFPNSLLWDYIYHITIGWIISIIYILVYANWMLYSNDRTVTKFLIKAVLAILIISPALGLISEFVFNKLFTFGSFILIFFTTSLYTIFLILLTSFLLTLITGAIKLYYD